MSRDRCRRPRPRPAFRCLAPVGTEQDRFWESPSPSGTVLGAPSGFATDSRVTTIPGDSSAIQRSATRFSSAARVSPRVVVTEGLALGGGTGGSRAAAARVLHPSRSARKAPESHRLRAHPPRLPRRHLRTTLIPRTPRPCAAFLGLLASLRGRDLTRTPQELLFRNDSAPERRGPKHAGSGARGSTTRQRSSQSIGFAAAP